MADKPGLSPKAYVPLPKGEVYTPYVEAERNLDEFTFKAILFGILFGVVFGAANAYLGLRAGLTISTSIPVAVMTVAVLRVLQSAGVGSTILEANLSQTTGSASSSVASGVIFTLPALFMWGVAPDLLQMTLLAMCGGLLGVLFMIPLRRFLIEREHGRLPYPEGTACAEVLVASDAGNGELRPLRRIGRVQYIGYALGVDAVVFGLTYLLFFMRGDIEEAFPEHQTIVRLGFALVFLLIYVPVLVLRVRLTIQRVHDFNAHGRLAFLLVVPVLPLIFWFLPGTQGPNDYGDPPPKGEGLGQARYVFYGLAGGALFKALTSWASLIPADVYVKIPVLKKGELGMDLSAALFGVGYILGPRIAAIMVGGGLLSWLLIIPALAYWGEARELPLFPETQALIRDMPAGDIWSRYVRYIGAGAVAAAGIMTLIRSIPVMIESFRIGARQLGQGVQNVADRIPRTARDLPLKVLGAGLVIIALVLAGVPQVFGAVGGFAPRLVAALCVIVFAFFFVTGASRIVGLVGVTSNPTSGMTIAALLGTAGVFLVLGWTDLVGKAATLTVGCVVAIAASISGDTSQDLKTGYLLGATPRRQQLAELIGVLTTATFVCLSVLLLDRAFGFGSDELPAPQATLMKLVIDGVLEQALPWELVGIGVAIAVICELFRIPSLPFAVGVYLPVSTMTPIFVGGLVRMWMERKARSDAERNDRRGRGVLLGSGFVGGEGLLGVGIAAVAFAQGRKPDGIGTDWLGPHWLAMLVGAGVFALLITWFVRRVR